jgi:hypothetical protein
MLREHSLCKPVIVLRKVEAAVPSTEVIKAKAGTQKAMTEAGSMACSRQAASPLTQRTRVSGSWILSRSRSPSATWDRQAILQVGRLYYKVRSFYR